MTKTHVDKTIEEIAAEIARLQDLLKGLKRFQGRTNVPQGTTKLAPDGLTLAN